MTGSIAAAALGSAAVLSCLVYVARQVESTIPVVTSLIKKLIDARQEITEHYHAGNRSTPATAAEAPDRQEQLPGAEPDGPADQHEQAA